MATASLDALQAAYVDFSEITLREVCIPNGIYPKSRAPIGVYVYAILKR